MSNPTPKPIAIIPADNGFKVSIPGEAIRWKEQALARAEHIKQVTTAEEQTAAIEAASILKGLVQGVEVARKEIKDPYFQAGKAIDAKAKEFVTDIQSRLDKIEDLLGAFQASERRKAEEARREEERKAREAQQAFEREQQRLAELQRQQQAAEALAASAKTAKAREEAAKEAARLEAEAMQAEIDAAEAQDTAQEAAAAGPLIEAPRATGAAVGDKVDFEVTDIEAFYAWDVARRKEAQAIGRNLPTFVKLEVIRGVFKQYIGLLDRASLDSIPGVKITERTDVSVRAVSPSLALQ